MNFLDAHRIVHEFSEAVGKGVESADDWGFRPISYIPFEFDKDKIFKAFQIFFAHMILYKTRSQGEYEKYKTVFMAIKDFIPDEDLFNIRLASEIASKKGFINKLIYGEKINDANKIMETMLSNRVENLKPECSEFDDLMKYVAMVEYYYTSKIGDINNYSEDDLDNVIEEYIIRVYKLANIEYKDDYFNFFQPFSVMRNVITFPEYKVYFEGYEDYINSNQ